MSAVFVDQLLLVELKKNCQNSWRTLVRPDISSTFCRFELMSGRTNVLDPVRFCIMHWALTLQDLDTKRTELTKAQGLRDGSEFVKQPCQKVTQHCCRATIFE